MAPLPEPFFVGEPREVRLQLSALEDYWLAVEDNLALIGDQRLVRLNASLAGISRDENEDEIWRDQIKWIKTATHNAHPNILRAQTIISISGVLEAGMVRYTDFLRDDGLLRLKQINARSNLESYRLYFSKVLRIELNLAADVDRQLAIMGRIRNYYAHAGPLTDKTPRDRLKDLRKKVSEAGVVRRGIVFRHPDDGDDFLNEAWELWNPDVRLEAVFVEDCFAACRAVFDRLHAITIGRALRSDIEDTPPTDASGA
jgi:hypothetical protein